MIRFPLLLTLIVPAATVVGQKPNIIFSMADDLGGQDGGFTGAKFFETQHFDKLARAGSWLSRLWT